MLGGVFGLAMLLAAFLLPFSNIAEGTGTTVDSLLTIFKIFVIGVSNFQVIGLTQLAELAYVYMAVFVLVLFGGVVGAYPRWAALFSIAGIVTATVAPFAIFTSYSFSLSDYGAGFYAIWATSLLMIFAAYWSSRERRSMAIVEEEPTEEATEPEPSEPSEPQTEAESGESVAT
jgi:hypothetical protein